jgi:phage shock protein C
MFVMPVNPNHVQAGNAPRSTGTNAKFWGILLVVVGTLWLLRNLDIPYYLHWWGFSWEYVLPVLLIMAGVAFMFGGRSGIMNSTPEGGSMTEDATNGNEGDPTMSANPGAIPPPPARLYRSRLERKISGVCGGIGVYLNVDPTIIRILFVVGILASFGFMILVYLAMAIIIPNEQEPISTTTPIA